MGLAVVVCHFFRKFCQDPPQDEEEVEKEMTAPAEGEAKIN